MPDVDPVSGQIEQLQRALNDARGTATSPDGALRAEVGANGTFHSLELTVEGEALTPQQVVAMVVDLHRQAQAQAALAMHEAVAALGNDPRLREGRRAVADSLAAPSAEQPPASSPSVSSTPMSNRPANVVEAQQSAQTQLPQQRRTGRARSPRSTDRARVARKPDRDMVVEPTDVVDEETLYFRERNRNGWLIDGWVKLESGE